MNDQQLPSTGQLRQIFELKIEQFALTGDEQAYQDAQWASRLLTKLHQEKREQAQKEEAK